MSKYDIADEHESDVSQRRIEFVAKKWSIPRSEAKRMLENHGVGE